MRSRRAAKSSLSSESCRFNPYLEAHGDPPVSTHRPQPPICVGFTDHDLPRDPVYSFAVGTSRSSTLQRTIHARVERLSHLSGRQSRVYHWIYVLRVCRPRFAGQ